MSNDFFDDADYVELARFDLARAEDVNDIAAAVVVGFDRLPSQARIFEGRIVFCGTSAGAPNAQTVTAPYTITLTEGLHLRFKAGFTNTGAITINPSTLGAINLFDFGGNALVGGEVIANSFLDIVYSASAAHFRIMNPLVNVGSITTFDITALNTSASPADADFLATYDASAGFQTKVTMKDGLISGWPANTAPLDADTLLTLKASSGLLKQITLANLLVAGWTAATQVGANDTILVRVSGNLRQVKRSNFSPTSGITALAAAANLGAWGT